MATPEQFSGSAEHSVEAPKLAAEQLEKLNNNPESAPERSKEQTERSVETATVEALETAISVEKSGAERDRKEPASAPKRHGVVSKKEREKSFTKHMTHLQNELPPASRVFSKIIHNKAIEKTSEFIGGSVARPDAILSGAVAAFVLVLAVYLTAKSFGYVLSGFETIAAFMIGWILGVVYDYIKLIVTGKTQ